MEIWKDSNMEKFKFGKRVIRKNENPVKWKFEKWKNGNLEKRKF